MVQTAHFAFDNQDGVSDARWTQLPNRRMLKSMTPRICAVIVTHNRLDLLKLCVQKVKAQSTSISKILIMDNASDAETGQWIHNECKDVWYVRSDINLGGAGGFSAGVEKVLIDGSYDYVWLMDDDAFPHEKCVQELITVAEDTGAAFVSPRVLSPEGVELSTHRMRHITPSRNHGISPTDPVAGVECASFVGPLIRTAVARRTWLPVADFFLWWDDVEYTSRLQKIGGGLHNPSAIVYHPPTPTDVDIGKRLFYDIRGRLWMTLDGRLGSSFSRQKAYRWIWYRIRTQFVLCRSKRSYFRYLIRGVTEGVMRRPLLRSPSDDQ